MNWVLGLHHLKTRFCGPFHTNRYPKTSYTSQHDKNLHERCREWFTRAENEEEDVKGNEYKKSMGICHDAKFWESPAAKTELCVSACVSSMCLTYRILSISFLPMEASDIPPDSLQES
jgi:hypothetical protein